jgi:hypothetical protein
MIVKIVMGIAGAALAIGSAVAGGAFAAKLSGEAWMREAGFQPDRAAWVHLSNRFMVGGAIAGATGGAAACLIVGGTAWVVGKAGKIQGLSEDELARAIELARLSKSIEASGMSTVQVQEIVEAV